MSKKLIQSHEGGLALMQNVLDMVSTPIFGCAQMFQHNQITSGLNYPGQLRRK